MYILWPPDKYGHTDNVHTVLKQAHFLGPGVVGRGVLHQGMVAHAQVRVCNVDFTILFYLPFVSCCLCKNQLKQFIINKSANLQIQLQSCFLNVIPYVQDINNYAKVPLRSEQFECRPAGDWGGGAIVLCALSVSAPCMTCN